MIKHGSFKFKKSSFFGVLIIYYVLMDSSFPFGNNDKLVNFFYWTKFGIALIIILYVMFLYNKQNILIKKNNKKISYLVLMPWFVMFLYSCFIWLLQKTPTPYITRGVSNFLSIILPISLGLALFDIYKEETVRLVVISICLMSFSNYIVGFIVNGFSFLPQLLNIYCEESTYRIYKELHEIAYIAGILLLYYFHNTKCSINKLWLIYTIVIFIIAWKRIGILALVISILFYFLMSYFDRSDKKNTIKICGSIIILVCIIYVWMSASDELSIVLNKYGINMMGRDVLYSYFRRFCDFTIQYPGRGIGFVSRQFNYMTWADVGEMIALKQGLHNDLFSLYLEIGMIGYVLWLIYQLIYVPTKIVKMSGINCTVKCFTYIIFTFITYTTDNTLRYFVYQMVLTIIIAATCYESRSMNKKINKYKRRLYYENYAK